MKIFLDLDGTVIDSKMRLYHLFQVLVRDSNLTFEKYWELKMSGYNHEIILKEQFNHNELQILDFKSKWMNMIETSEMLILDKCFEYTVRTLSNLSSVAELYIVTDRQFKDRAIQQLKHLGIFDFFCDIYVTEQKINKSELILSIHNITKNDYFVGDTGHDILSGKKIGAQTVAVLSGFMNRSSLIKYEPDYLVESIEELKFKLMNQ